MGAVAEDRTQFRLICDWLLAERQILKICATVQQSPKICRKDRALELWPKLGDGADQAARLAGVVDSATPSVNLTPAMTLGN